MPPFWQYFSCLRQPCNLALFVGAAKGAVMGFVDPRGAWKLWAGLGRRRTSERRPCPRCGSTCARRERASPDLGPQRCESPFRGMGNQHAFADETSANEKKNPVTTARAVAVNSATEEPPVNTPGYEERPCAPAHVKAGACGLCGGSRSWPFPDRCGHAPSRLSRALVPLAIDWAAVRGFDRATGPADRI
jgi:hypothetical protein